MSFDLKKMANLLRLGVPTLEAARQVCPSAYDRLARGDELATLLPCGLREVAVNCSDLPSFLDRVAANEHRTSQRRRVIRAASLYPATLFVCWLVFCLLSAPKLIWLPLLGVLVALVARPYWHRFVSLREQADFLRWLAFFLPYAPLPQAAALARDSSAPQVWVAANSVCRALEAGDTLAQALGEEQWSKLLTVEEPSHLLEVSQVLERRCSQALTMFLVAAEPMSLGIIGLLVLAVARWCYPVGVPW